MKWRSTDGRPWSPSLPSMTRRGIVRAPEALPALRVVAASEALDELTAPAEHPVLRLAPDELLVIGAASVEVTGEHLVVDESGFVGWWLTPEELRNQVVPHVDWPLP